MSRELLNHLYDERAFEATRRFADLELFHVRFDELTGTEETEGRLARLAERQGKIGILGPTGSGKSSAIASVLGPFAAVLPERVIPLRIPVAASPPEEVTEPSAFARHVGRTVLRYATEILSDGDRRALDRGMADLRRAAERQRSWSLRLGAPRLLADAGLTADVKGRAEETEHAPAGGEIVAELQRLIETFRARDREPFLIIDDSDAWLRIDGSDLAEVASRFFDRVVRMLAKEVDCGFIVAVHDEYTELDAYRSAGDWLSAVIEIPTLPDGVAGVTRILAGRLELFDSDAVIEEVIEPDAVAVLADRYAATRNVRDLLRTVDRALEHASSDGLAVLGPDLVRSALAELR